VEHHRLERREIGDERRLAFLGLDSAPVDRDVREVRTADALVEAIDERRRVLVRPEVLGLAATGDRHLVEQIAVHRRADPEREDVRVADLLARERDDLFLVSDVAVGHEDDVANASRIAG
jgi:RNase adaptor protein for sRNA GlmZ degradation